jgi:alkanesulfonate monooxygenase SsuD/methylene tetrahydromethanopterin reductase-like flavin-dependent oxidoreductase (luciferase family)
MPFDGRFTHIEEQIEVCRLLWSHAPASYSGKFINFKDIWSFPRPAQPTLPIWLGIKPTERNCVRMGRLADGWLPDNMGPHFIRTSLASIRTEMERAGRDPAYFGVRAGLMPVFGASGTIDFNATFAQAHPLIEAGVTQIDAATSIVIQQVNQVPDVIGRLTELKLQFT